jgi:hypothetical protein
MALKVTCGSLSADAVTGLLFVSELLPLRACRRFRQRRPRGDSPEGATDPAELAGLAFGVVRLAGSAAAVGSCGRAGPFEGRTSASGPQAPPTAPAAGSSPEGP